MRDVGWLVLLPGFVAAAAVVVMGYLRGRLFKTTAMGAGVSAVVWVAGVALMLTEWKDIDGWVDCYECDGWHKFGAFLFWTPLVGAGSLALVGLLAGVSRVMKSRARPEQTKLSSELKDR